MAERAVVLVSGGLDSAVTLAIAKNAGCECHAISFDYGQRHRVELEAASRVTNAARVASHTVVPLDLRIFGGSALTDTMDVPKDRDADTMADGIPITYVPARNLMFLSLAVAHAEVIGATSIYLGVNAVDYSGYPDCRPQFITSFEETANLATKAGVEGGSLAIHAPLMHLAKHEIVQRAADLGVDLSVTVSCYDPDLRGHACGRCDSCQLRRAGFEQAGISDPTRYQQPR
ncbi:MAG: 7-cyano-7-deazaguanine synthase QueC [Planctomycetota bacterium]